MKQAIANFGRCFIMPGSRKAGLGYVYLLGHFFLALVIILFRPDFGLAGLATLAGALAVGLGTVIAGHAYESYQNGKGPNGNPEPPPSVDSAIDNAGR